MRGMLTVATRHFKGIAITRHLVDSSTGPDYVMHAIKFEDEGSVWLDREAALDLIAQCEDSLRVEPWETAIATGRKLFAKLPNGDELYAEHLAAKAVAA